MQNYIPSDIRMDVKHYKQEEDEAQVIYNVNTMSAVPTVGPSSGITKKDQIA